MQDGSQKLKQPHEALTKQMGAVFSELLDYVIRSSPLIPDMQTDMDQLDSLGRLGEVWHDHDWQRVRGSLQPLERIDGMHASVLFASTSTSLA